MAISRINAGRRGFFSRVFKGNSAETIARIDSEIRTAKRLEAWEETYQSELRAFGPDLLIETARRSGSVDQGADYAKVAMALAQDFEKANHGD
ncbi:MAG: hypothetical protein IPN98_01650 [Propionivibrio sp.]|nr:hypothetical protein [Propionivibrio sp.]